jgi:hypothetical protein
MVTLLKKQSQKPKSMQSESALKSATNHNGNILNPTIQKIKKYAAKIDAKKRQKYKIYNKTR